MVINTQRKVFLALLAVAGAALAVDRFVAGGAAGPQSANASPAAPAPVAIADKPRADRPVSTESATAHPATVADKLAAIDEHEGSAPHAVRDIFEPPTGWFAPPPVRAAEAPHTPDNQASLHGFRLGAVIANRAAVVNGVPIQVGETSQSRAAYGVKLLAADNAGAEIEVSGRRFRIERDLAAGRADSPSEHVPPR